MRRIVNVFIVVMSIAVPALAQQGTPTPPVAVPAPTSRAATAPQTVTPAATAAPQRGQTPAPPAAVAAAHAPDPRIDQSDVNIKLTVKITDTGSGGAQTKTVSLIMANKGSGRVRSQGTTLASNVNHGSELNVDANATLFKSGVVNTWLTITYTPEWAEADVTKMTGVSQQVSLYLKDGVPTVIAQAADPTKGSRSVAIEVTVSVMK